MNTNQRENPGENPEDNPKTQYGDVVS